MRQQVGDYFKQKNLDPKNPISGLWRLALFFITFVISYFIMAGDFSVPSKFIAAILFGSCQALPLLHTMHDASHTSIGSTPTWWSCVGRFCMDWMAGASLTSWHNQHVLGHHVYTNLMGADPDLPVVVEGDIRRLTSFQKWLPQYKYQHIYLLFAYGFLALKFRVQDVIGMIDHTNGPIRVNGPYIPEYVYQFITKSTWIFWRIFVPIFVWGQSVGEFFVYFFIAEFITGWYLAFNFQVSHVSTPLEWLDIKRPIDDEWAVSQIKTSLDYAHGSFLCTFLSGALNYQTVHHLFPSVSQYHYPAIAPIIQAICKKWNVPYNHVDSFSTAFYLHVEHLHTMGNDHLIFH
jgi:fatty acid desaturase